MYASREFEARMAGCARGGERGSGEKTRVGVHGAGVRVVRSSGIASETGKGQQRALDGGVSLRNRFDQERMVE
jgi:hypothetical protein